MFFTSTSDDFYNQASFINTKIRNLQFQKDYCSVISILFSMRVGEISALEALAFEEEKAKKEYTER